MTTLPIIDVAPLLDAGSLTTPAAATQIRALEAACRGPGFFYLANHGVAREAERALFDVARRFFALPLAKKLEIENIHSPCFRGYTRVGHERTQNMADWREQIDAGAERVAQTLAPSEPLFLRLRGPNQWPSELPELRPALLAWSRALDAVAIAVTRALAIALGQHPHHFDAAFLPEPDTHLKVIRYPGTADDGEQGVGPHKDYGFLAFVLQDAVGGLEVDDLQGGFRPATPIPGTLVANLGEMFEVATRGYFRATVHRVRSPRAPSDRISLAHFFCPKLEAVLGEVPLPAELAVQRSEYVTDPDNPIYAEFGQNALRGWTRSHPEVARRHYPELTAST